jgi:LacI family transcriptional regulator
MVSAPSISKPRVTQSDVARVAGVHNTTVSLSLRNSPAIPEATRHRIKALAAEMGYAPDPALQALVAYRNGQKANRPRETLAFLTYWDSRWGWRAIAAQERAFLGAERRAEDLGYHLEHFWMGEPGMSQRRLSNVLYHRGIKGVLLGCHAQLGEPLAEMDWSQFSAVKLGHFPQGPRFSRVADDHGGMARLAMMRIRRAGFERVGCVTTQWWDDYTDHASSTGFLVEQSRTTAGRAIPILRLAGARHEWMTDGIDAPTKRAAGTQLAAWYDEHRPDVIVGASAHVLTLLESMGLVVPRDVAFVDLGLETSDRRVAGIRQNSENTGEVAMTALVRQVQQNARGIPAISTTTLVEGSWSEGDSMPERWGSVRPVALEYFESDLTATA